MSRIVFVDGVGEGFGWDIPDKGLGGSEVAQIVLANALRDRGHDVYLANRQTPRCPSTCDMMIISRMSQVNQIQAHRVVVSLTDMGPHRVMPNHFLVGVSHWQVDRWINAGYGGRTLVIPPIVPKMPKMKKVKNRFIFASAAMKGLKPTLEMWERVYPELPKGSELLVTHAGWDAPKPDTVWPEGSRYIGDKNPMQIRREIAQSEALFYVNEYPETFCVVAAMAEKAGCKCHILCSKGTSGIREAINSEFLTEREDVFIKNVVSPIKFTWQAKDFSVKSIVEKWEGLLP